MFLCSARYANYRALLGLLSSSLFTTAGLRAESAGGGSAKAVVSIAPGKAYRQTNLVSDMPGVAPVLDPLLVNPWGIAFRGTGPFWVANNGTSTTQLLRGDVSGAPFVLNSNPQTINIPGGLPTGVVANTTTDFQITPPGGGTAAPADYVFDSITGNIVAWNSASGPTAQNVVSKPGHVYTGLAIGNNGGNNRLYAVDFANSHIDVFTQTFGPAAVSGDFVDSTIPAGYAPFNIQNLGGSFPLYVTYAKVDPMHPSDDLAGVGNGLVRRFSTDGVRDLSFAINDISTDEASQLNSPWGLAIAPASFGVFGGALLVGNFGEGNPSIHAYNPTTGDFLGTLQDESGNGIVIDELWSLQFGNGGNGGDANTLYFTAGTAGEEHGIVGKLKPTTATATSLIQFATSSFSVPEQAGHVDVTVIRSGDTSGTATVNYATFDESQAGHASQKSDYEFAAGTLVFKPGESVKTFRIFIVDDLFVEGDEIINVVLSNPTGAGVGLGSPNIEQVTITDNDTTTTSNNPLAASGFYIRQLYLDLLNREPDAGTLGFLTQYIDACDGDTNCTNVRRLNAAFGFFTSMEWQQAGLTIWLANKAAFGGSASGSPAPVLYGQFMIDLHAINAGLPFRTAGWEQQFSDQVHDYFKSFLDRPTFVSAYPPTLTPAQFVDALYTNTGVTPSTSERNAAIGEFGGASDTSDKDARARVLSRITQNTTFQQAELNKFYVAANYFGFLRRDPDTAGFNFWLTDLNAHGGDLRVILPAFVFSSEYNQRFGASNAVVPNPTPSASPTPSQSLNISTRLNVGTAENQKAIGGFIVTGSAPKKVLIRAVGPSLTSRGVAGAMDDPVLELHSGDGSLIVSNDNWKDNQQSEIEATGIPPSDERESAIVATLNAGSYTAVVRGKNNTTGVVLVEIYDLNQAAASRLANLSTRGFVETQG